jgi:hypothetical protein
VRLRPTWVTRGNPRCDRCRLSGRVDLSHQVRPG